MFHTTKKAVLFNELTEEDKGEFVEMDNETLQKLIAGMNVVEDELGSSFNFDKVYDAEYYALKFPGFDDFVYDILEQETINLNKDPPLSESNDEVPLSEN
jgi:hypothetical protein